MHIRNLALSIMALTSLTFAQEAVFVEHTTSQAFNQALDSTRKAVSSQGMMVMGEIDQKGALSSTGLKLEGAHAFLVGNPVFGRQLFEMTPAAGALVPLRLYLWVDSEDVTHISYFLPSALLKSIDPGLAEPGSMLDESFAKIATEVAGQ